MRVGIVSFEFEGATKNGGIGTAYRLLAETLAASGAQVTVLLAQQNYSDADLRKTQAALKGKGIEIETVPVPPRFDRGNPWFVSQSIAVCERLRARRFDVVHFAENIACGYYAVLCKKLGLDFKTTTFVCGLHGSTSWVHEVSGNPFPTPEQVMLYEFEKRAAEMADVVVSPSEYMLNYVRSSGWKLPEKSFALANVNRMSQRASRPKGARPKTATQLVFFGRLERRKGILLFVEALQKYLNSPSTSLKSQLSVIFLGKDVQLPSQELASDFIRRELRPFSSSLKLYFKNDFSSEAAIQYLREHPESLVCMPSPVDNSPYVIVEALEEGLNFLSSNRGGQGELIHPEDHEAALFDPTPASLARKFAERLERPAPVIRPAPGLARMAERWVALHQEWAPTEQSRVIAAVPLRKDAPLVSICISPATSEAALHSLWESLENMLYSRVELLVAQGPRLHEIPAIPTRRILKGGAKTPWMRTFAQAAEGKYVLFLDEATSLQSHAINLLTDVAERTGSDRICSAFSCFPSDHVPHSVIPTPEDSVGTLLRFDSRVPLLFMDRKKFLNESRGWTPGDAGSEQALWMLQSSALGRPFVCVPKPLLRILRSSPSLEELERYCIAACTVLESHVPRAISFALRNVVSGTLATRLLERQVKAKERALQSLRQLFPTNETHA